MTLFNISISNVSIYNKEDAAREISNIWKNMSAVKVGLEQLRFHIETKHNPFICCARKSEWKNQRLFCIDIDNFNGDFDTLIRNLDELELYPCFGYTTFNNAEYYVCETHELINATEYTLINAIYKNGKTEIGLYKDDGESWVCDSDKPYCSSTTPWV